MSSIISHVSSGMNTVASGFKAVVSNPISAIGAGGVIASLSVTQAADFVVKKVIPELAKRSLENLCKSPDRNCENDPLAGAFEILANRPEKSEGTEAYRVIGLTLALTVVTSLLIVVASKPSAKQNSETDTNK